MKDTPDRQNGWLATENIQCLNYFKALKNAESLHDDTSNDSASAILFDSERQDQRIPFLTIITRTQGKRPEALKAVFDCLKKQKDQDFEVILILHTEKQSEDHIVKTLLSQQPMSLRQKIRYMILEGGTRTAPLNLGLKQAQGQYVAVLDDDDLVTEDWVENFHQAALKYDDAIIRCYGQSQIWRYEIHETGFNELVPVTDPGYPNVYCSPFSLKAHFAENGTPISCAAYPVKCLRAFGLVFDESLNTTEDWDFFLRCALLFEVVDTKKVSFLYRVWENAESSRSLHNMEEWLDNKDKIFRKWDKIPVVTTRKALCETESGDIRFKPLDYNHPLSFLRHYLKRCIRERINRRKNTDIIRNAAFFDGEWYIRTYPDVKEFGGDPALHYFLTGWIAMRDPSPAFSTRKYLLLNPDVAAQQICPLLHYEQSGRKEGRRYERAN